MSSTLKPKSLCKLSKDSIAKHMDELAAVTRNSEYLCQKCARSAKAKKWLCKPIAI